MGRAEITRSDEPRSVKGTISSRPVSVRPRAKYRTSWAEEHLLRLGVRHRVLQPILLRVALVPLESGGAGEELREKQHWAEGFDCRIRTATVTGNS